MVSVIDPSVSYDREQELQEILQRAETLAREKHARQKDRGGHPYFLHVQHVANQCEHLSAKIVAMVHDLREDTDTTVDDLKAIGLERWHLEAVDLLTRRPGETAMDAALRLINSKRTIARAWAIEVKLHDNAHNLDLTRLKYVSTRDLPRLNDYLDIRRLLLAAK